MSKRAVWTVPIAELGFAENMQLGKGIRDGLCLRRYVVPVTACAFYNLFEVFE